MSYSNELHQWFKEHNGKRSVCCRVLKKEFDMGKGEHKMIDHTIDRPTRQKREPDDHSPKVTSSLFNPETS